MDPWLAIVLIVAILTVGTIVHKWIDSRVVVVHKGTEVEPASDDPGR